MLLMCIIPSSGNSNNIASDNILWFYLYTGGKKFTYVTGDGVIRTMNAIFGNGGWSSRILDKELIVSERLCCWRAAASNTCELILNT